MATDFDPRNTITHLVDQVWNQKNVGELYRHAVANVVVWGPSGRELYGRDAWMTDILSWLAAFPDTEVTIQDVIVRGADGDGWLVSERRQVRGHNHGISRYGPATGRAIDISSLVHYRIFDGKIREVWQEWDEVGVIEQLQFELPATMTQLQSYYGFDLVGDALETVGEIERMQGQLPPQGYPEAKSKTFDVEAFLKGSLHEIWNWRLVGHIRETYAQNVAARILGQALTGQEEVATYVLAQLAAYPDLAFHMDHVFFDGDGRSGYRVASRWTILGTHRGPSPFGPPTGKRIRMQGLSQHLIRRGQILEEWTEAGTLGLWARIGKRPERDTLSETGPDDPSEVESTTDPLLPGSSLAPE